MPQDQQQQQEVAVEAMREEGDNDDREREQRREKRYQRETEEISRDTNFSEDDKDSRPVKRRKLPRVSTDEATALPCGHNLKRCLRQPHRLTPPPATQVEIDNVQSQAE